SLVPSPNVGLARRILRGRVGGTATNRGAWNSPITRRLPSFKALITVVLEIPAALRAIMAVGNSSIMWRLLSQRPNYRRLRHPAARGDVAQRQTFRAQLLNLRCRNRNPRSTQSLALGASIAETG